MQKRLNAPPAEEGVPNTIRISGCFTTNGTSDPTAKSSGPWSVTYAATGKYTILFKENVKEILSVHCNLEVATNSTESVKPVSGQKSVGTVAAAASIQLVTQSSSGTAAALTGPIVNFEVVFRKGSLTK